ncbi:MAG: hypothetical protein RLZZ435_481 [Cyanobacteriota bacterium]|jgi:hypothetical protein
MIITTPIQTYKLPKDLYPDRLENELQQFSDVDWQNFAQGLPLIALGGKLTNDLPLSSGLKPTSLLTQCPTLQNWLSQSSIVLGRTRIVQLKSEEQRSYNDSQTYYQSVHRSLWIPLLNGDQCSLKIQGESFSLDPNRLYLFNPSDRYSLSYHGNDRFLALWIETPLDFDLPNWINNPYQFKLDLKPTLSIVPYCFRVINPLELDNLLEPLKTELQSEAPLAEYQALVTQLDQFSRNWIKAFHQFGYSLRGELTYRDLILFFKENITTKANRYLSMTGQGQRSLKIIGSALMPTEQTGLRQFSRQVMAKRKKEVIQAWQGVKEQEIPHFKNPIFIVSAPRAGSTLLFETLSRFPEFWSIGKESHDLIEGISELHPSSHHYQSNQLDETIVTPEIIQTLQKRFVAQLRNSRNISYLSLDATQRSQPIRLLEKTPKNALRISFLKAVFPEARFIYLYRKPAANISSMLEGWRLRRFVSYRDLPNWPYKEWSFLLIPNWQNLTHCSLAEIVAHQWTAANTCIFNDLQQLPRHEWQFIDYDDLVNTPQTTIRNMSKFAGLMPDETIERSLAKGLPTSCMTLSASSPDKWRKHEDEINPVLPLTHSICSLVEELKWSQP